MPEEFIERAARKLCVLRGLDPDENWQDVEAEIERHLLVHQAIKDTFLEGVKPRKP